MNKNLNYKALTVSISVFLVLMVILAAVYPKKITVRLDFPGMQNTEVKPGADLNTPPPAPAPVPAPSEDSNKEPSHTSPSPENASDMSPAEPDNSASAPEKGLTSSDPAEIAAFYCKSRKITKAPKGHQQMILANNGKIEGGGLVGVFAKAGAGIVDSVLKKNSTETTWIPGDVCNDILPADVETASAVTSADGKYTDIKMTFKGQTDGPDGDNKNGGPVARSIGTLGSVDDAVNQLGASFKEGRENIKLIYSDAWLECSINNDTGMIEKGTWHYIVMLNISEAKVTFVGITGSAKDVVAGIDFTVTI